MIFKKTKIICTIGPAVSSPEKMSALIDAGMDIARLNFSHSTHEEHLEVINLIRGLAHKKDIIIPVLGDLSGPKIRTGSLKGGSVKFEKGKTIKIFSQNVTGDENGFSTNYDKIIEDINPGEKILLDDGKLMLKVLSKDKTSAVCEILNSGILNEHKGINLPDTKISLPSLTEKDYKDLDFLIENKADFIALSFVRKPEDITELKNYIHGKNANIPVISKLERPEAIKNIDGIIQASDAVMVARGDLGVEISPEDIPSLQKMIIRKSNELCKPVITATQMLESMISNPLPTRAEATDVANAILDGTDCVMLSGETSVGAYAIESVETMERIIGKTEDMQCSEPRKIIKEKNHSGSTLWSVCRSAVELSDSIKASAIVTLTKSGKSPHILSHLRPHCPVLAVSGDSGILHHSKILWGVMPVYITGKNSFAEITGEIKSVISDFDFLKKGDKVIFILSLPFYNPDSANSIHIIEL
ncbi:MAG TPA: pyruvate kinase [Ignavibacteria bacterium]|nr:pyruvate kinase [Ignavibacteria bacterium]